MRKLQNRFTSSKSVPEATEACVLHRFSRRFRIRPRKRASRGSEGAKSRTRALQSALRQSAIRAILGSWRA
eukprot:10598262-Alexandrium_andersonii.AAC.1